MSIDDVTTRGPQGFAQIPRWVQQSDTISGPAKLVYLALSSRSDRYGQSHPSHATLAREASCSVATVKRALEDLRQLDLVDWDVRFRDDNEGQTSNVYTIAVGQRPSSQGAAPRLPMSRGVAQGELPPSSVRATKNETQKNETQKNEEELLSDASGVLVVAVEAPSVDDDFEAFWTVWPRKVAKKPAADVYRRLRRRIPAEVILAGARRYAAETAGREAEHIAHATSWLRAERWTDEVARPAAAPTPTRRITPAEQALAELGIPTTHTPEGHALGQL